MSIENAYQNSICKIECGTEKGTGFFIEENTILTVFHVIVDANLKKEEIIISFLGDLAIKHKAVVLAFEKDLDVAILKIGQNTTRPLLKLLKTPIFIEEKWYSFGIPATETGQLAGDDLEGTIKKRITFNEETIHDTDLYCIQFNPQFIYNGFSGSPVFDEKGNVFAILRKKLNRGLGAISISKLYSFLQKNEIEVETDYEKYETKPFSRNWFIEHSKNIITNAGPRYTRYANVELEYDKYFEAASRDSKFQVDVRKLFGNTKIKFEKINLKRNTEVDEIRIKIEEALRSLFSETAKVLKLSIDKPIQWEAINDVAHETHKIVDEQLSLLYAVNKKKKPDNKYSSGQYDYEINRVRALLNSIRQIIDFSESLPAKLSIVPFFLLKGKAGQGKTHLLCDIAVNRIERDEPTLMLFGQHFNNTDPWQQIISLLGLEYSKIEFLERLNEIGVKKQKKCLLFIDALNEGAGKELWKNHIDSVISDVKKYPWIGLVISIRTPFENAIIPHHLIKDNHLYVINHWGFKNAKYSAVREYFQYYKIELFSVPILDSEFSNPLFLKTFCEAFKKKRYYRLPKGAQKFSFVFDLFLEQKNISICEKIDADPKLKILEKALNFY